MTLQRLAALLLGLALVATGLGVPAIARPPASPQGVVDPVVVAELAAAASTDLLPVIVVLKDQADLRAYAGRVRKARLADVESALKRIATLRQRLLLLELRALSTLGRVGRIEPLWIFNGVSIDATPGTIRALATRTDVARIVADRTVAAPQALPGGFVAAAPATASLAAAHVPDLWALGLQGNGVVVASMDTGVDISHPELAARWRGGTNSWYDPNGQHPQGPLDLNGHGTQTTGVIVAGDASGQSLGVAPGARWIAVKIFNDRGQASSTSIHKGFQWLLDPDGNPATADAPNVVNNSWTTSTFACLLDFQLDLQSLRSAGILPVFAAGNFGPMSGSIASPANLPEAFAVGSVDSTNGVDPTSSRGPSSCAGAQAPAVVAPGVGIATTDRWGGYVTATGTSLAAPLVSGVLALLLQASPSLPADRQQAALLAGVADLGVPGPDNDYGHGIVDALAAYRTLTVTPDFSIATAPATVSTASPGAATLTVTGTAVNGWVDDVTLDVSGLPVGVTWSATPASLAGATGTAQVDVTVPAGMAPGSYPFNVVGTGAGASRGATATLVVTPPPDFTVGLTPASVSVTAGGSAVLTASVGALNGFTGTVSLSVSGVPSAVGTAVPSVGSTSGAGTASISLTTLATAPAGSYLVTVTGTGPDGTTHSASVTLTVTPAADWGISLPATATVRRGSTLSLAVSLTLLGSPAGPVTLSVTGLPNATTATWSRNPATPPTTVTLRLTTRSNTPRGKYVVTVAGSGMGKAHLATVTMTVN